MKLFFIVYTDPEEKEIIINIARISYIDWKDNFLIMEGGHNIKITDRSLFALRDYLEESNVLTEEIF